jgi:CYTH domain-containing protein
MEIELERTFLLKSIPVDLGTLRSMEVFDIYFPQAAEHPVLRVRKKGDKYEITKKHPMDGVDSSRQSEETIPLTEEEFLDFAKLPGKRVRKIRHYFQVGADMAEIDVFQDDLEGLILIDFEFKTVEAKDDFTMPDFCLADVTQELFTAGGILAGKKYADIEEELGKYGYRKF